jgi:hypothetical protein
LRYYYNYYSASAIRRQPSLAPRFPRLLENGGLKFLRFKERPDRFSGLAVSPILLSQNFVAPRDFAFMPILANLSENLAA